MSGSGFKGPHQQRGWINFAIAGVSALLSKRSSDKAGDQASSDRARELEIQEGHLDLARNQDERAGELYGHYRDTYMPKERELVDEAFIGVSPAREEAAATADVRSSLANARQMSDRATRRLGVDPSSGSYSGLEQQRGLEEARIEAGARTGARSSVRDLNFNRKAAVLGYASPTAASPYASAAQAGFRDASSLASMRSRDSAAASHEASANYGAALTNVADSGLEAWRTRRSRSSGEEAGGPYEPGRYEGYA